ncbi:hypothetical protein I317_07715 [Kwoniella heveanensis CBS 569]|nr:hypothetical protein I317_07715 [Kwoniella heveanensis CBS 569]
MGGLRERSEEELARAGREDLEIALRKEWQGRERLMLQLEEAENDRRKLEIQHEELVQAISSLQSRTDEAFSEQSRMEADLEERDDLLELMRHRVTEAEKQARESQRRYVEQEQTFDMERQALQAQEQHLQQRLKSIASSRRPITPTPEPTTSATEDLASLKDELASLNLSHLTVLAKLHTITKELHELKIANQELQEENEAWEYLVRERTLNGNLGGQGGLLSAHYANEDSDYRDSGSEPPLSAGLENERDRKTGLASLDEELEAEMDELHSDLEAQSPIFEDDHAFATNLDGSKKRIGNGNGLLAPPSGSRRRGRKERTVSGGSVTDRGSGSEGLDLAAELCMADDKSDEGESGVSAKADYESTALRAEVKQLKEANKALTLYCSKIIDRIIAQEGFEHILSVDYKTRRAGTRSGASKSRPALKDMTNADEWGMTRSPVSEEPPTKSAESVTVIPEAALKVEKKARPLSMMVRAISGPAPTVQAQAQDSTAPPIPQVDAANEAKTEKRARRGFSLDFRSLGFGSSSSSTPEHKSALKPLTLSSRSSTTGPSAASSSSASAASASRSGTSASSAARKLDIHEEDDEDRKERHRMEATLKLMGIDRKTSPPPTVQEEPETFSLGGKEWRSAGSSLGRRTVSSSSSSSEAGRKRRSVVYPSSCTTPLARLSSVLGTHEEPLPLNDVDPRDPAQLAAALQAMDEREAKIRQALSRGTAEKGYTSPPKISRGIPGGTGTERDRTVSKSESVKTLWSLGGGGDSRPNSGEIVVAERKA